MKSVAAILCLSLVALTGCESDKAVATETSTAVAPTNPFEAVAANAYPMNQLDKPLQLLDRDPMEFPDELRTKNREGTVYLWVVVNADGDVIACQVDQADHDEVAEVVRADIVKRQFSKPTVNGQPVEAYGRLPVPYRIGQGSLWKIMRKIDWESSSRKK